MNKIYDTNKIMVKIFNINLRVALYYSAFLGGRTFQFQILKPQGAVKASSIREFFKNQFFIFIQLIKE